jgi:hypothetical protein
VRISTVAAAFTLFVCAVAASAHHATAVQYDVSTTTTLKGVIIRVQWANPHTHVYVEVKKENDDSEVWTVEFPSPGALIVAGLSKQLLTAGTPLTIEGYLSKPGTDHSAKTRAACAKAVTLSDGNRFTFVVGI